MASLGTARTVTEKVKNVLYRCSKLGEFRILPSKFEQDVFELVRWRKLLTDCHSDYQWHKFETCDALA